MKKMHFLYKLITRIKFKEEIIVDIYMTTQSKFLVIKGI